MYEITGPEQKRPNNFQDALHNANFKKTLLKLVTSTWGEEKYVTILQHKELRVNCEDTCFLHCVEKVVKKREKWLKQKINGYGVTTRKLTQRYFFMLDI